MSEMLAQLLGGGGAPQEGPPPEAPPQQGPLDYLQECIQGIHQLVSELPDPGHTQMATQALAILTKIQRDLMTQQQGQGGLAGRLQGGG
jgi:hypothetical protein